MCLRKRTSFANVVKKTAFKLTIDAYKVAARVATNSYRVKSLIDGATYCLPGDQLIKVNLSETAMIQLVKSMEESAAKGVPRPSYPRTRGRTALDINSVDWFAMTQPREEPVISLFDCPLW